MDRDGRRNQSGSSFKFNSMSCQSPPSPEPLSPGDAFKKRSKSTTSFPSETEADKSGSCSFGRDPSFSEHDRAFLPSLFGSQDEPPEPDPSKVVAKMREEALSSSWKELPLEELLRSMGVVIPLTSSSFSNVTGSSYSGSCATNVSDDSRFTSCMSGVSTEIEESPPDTQFPLSHTFPKSKHSEHVQLGGPEEGKNLFLHAFSKNKKGCSFCGKDLCMQEKEVCIFCNAKFCRNCIINAMGSMPEGRKCIGCIGQPPHDSKTPLIGKSSKLLNNLVSNLEVLQIMKAEKECPTNQPQPEQVWVNGACLSAEEMLTLQGCSKPPKPGKYWYDSVTGFWGKDGCRPDRRISPTLKLGGPLMEKASKGNTQVYMNSRELGMIELTVLKMAGVHCLPGTHLWVAEDGSYREEGQTRSKGSLWAHTAVKTLYPFLSPPAPVSSSTGSGEDANDIFPAHPDVVEESQVQKLLLLGYEGSGRSTIFKQAKLLYKHGFTLDERRNLKMLVRSNILQYICILLEARERFEEECEAEIQLRNQIASISLGKLTSNGESEEPVSHSTENVYHMEAKWKEEGDYILEFMATGTLQSHFPRGTWMEQLSPIVKDLCNHTAMKATLQRQAEIPALSHFAGYFLDKVMEILDEDYQPSEDDILRVEGFTQGSGLMDIEFCLEDNVPLSQSCWQDSHSPIGRIGFFLDFPCTTDGHLKQENQFSTIGISDTTQNCFQTGLQEILTMGRKGKFEGVDSIEFLFKKAEDMSKVVGVGLQWSKVVVTKQFGVVVEHIGEHSWFDLWKETSFSPMRILIPKPPSELSMCNLTPEQSSKSFGVGLVGSRLENNRVYVEGNQNQTNEMFPFIFELAEMMGLSENAKDSNFQHSSGISTEVVEGEKNDHGSSLLETMEGGGETDQGGTSSEPMDPMDVGESSQGGNSGKSMEGVESGQGGLSSGPMEVGGQRDQQSSDFQLRHESLQAKGPQDSNENKSLTVIVIPEVGGTFYEGLSNRQVQPDCRIKGAEIAPWLKFKFEILGGERKITTTTETRCDLGGGQLTLHEDWDLGYCHDNITISLTCENRQSVQVSPGTVVAIDVMKRAMTETFTGSMSRANQIASQANVQVQMPMVPIRIQAQGTLEVTDTVEESHALADTVETSNTQFSGFNVNHLECAGSLVFNFLYPEEIVNVKARGKRQFIHAGINKTLWPTIVGKWFPLDREEARLYKFKTDRDIHSIGSLMRFMQQKYEVLFVINHAMSHIHYYEDKELRGPGVKSVDKVLIKLPEV